MSIYPVTENNIFCGGLSGSILISNDFGNNWNTTQVSTGYSIQRIFFADSLNGWILSLDKLFKTTTGGNNWTECDLGIDLSNYIYSDIKFLDNNVGWLLISSSSTYYEDIWKYPGQVLKTTNGGQDWFRVGQNIEGKLYEISLIDKDNIWVLSVQAVDELTFNNFLYKSDNSGQSWNKLTGPPVSIWRKNQMKFVDKFNGWVYNYRTTDGGINWYKKFDLSNTINGIEYLGKDSLVLYDDSNIFYSNDNGENWELENIVAETSLSELKFFNKNIGFLCGQGGNIYKTIDGGKYWIKISKGITKNLYDVDFIDEKRGWAVGVNGTMLSTENGGVSWLEQDIGVSFDLMAVDFTDDKIGWIVGDNCILNTIDGGKQWSIKLEYQDVIFTDIQFWDIRKGWVIGTNGTILTTNDGGETWTNKFTNTSTTLYSINFVDSLYGWISGKSSIILATTDGGDNWSRQSIIGNYTFQKLQFVDRKNGWVSAGDEMAFFRTTNGGLIWEQLVNNNYIIDGIHSFFFVDQNIGYASSFFYSDFLKTLDGGQSWIIVERLPTPRINSFKFQSSDLGWGVGYRGTIIKYLSVDSLSPSFAGETLVGNYPNPFSFFTTIYFILSYDQPVNVTIFGLAGKKIKTYKEALYPKGINRLYWEVKGLSSGTYFVSVQCQEYNKVIKCLLIK